MNTLTTVSLLLCVACTACASDPPPSANDARRPARTSGSRVQITDARISPAEGTNATVTMSPPAPASPSANGGLTPEQEAARVRVRLLHQVEDHYPELIACYDRGREHDGALQGRVAVRFTVAPSGDVVGLSDGGGTTLGNGEVVSCVQSTFTRMKFTSWDGKAVTATLPIDFTAP